MCLELPCKQGCCIWSRNAPASDRNKKRIKLKQGIPAQGRPKDKKKFQSFHDLIRDFTFPNEIIDLYIEGTQEHFLQWKEDHPTSKLKPPFDLQNMDTARAKFLAYLSVMLFSMAKGIKLQEIWASYKPSENIPFITETFPHKEELQSIHFHLHARPERLHDNRNPEDTAWKREWKAEIDRLVPFQNLDECEWEPGEYVTSDDGTITSKARMKAVTFNKAKPTKNRWGMKQDNLADGSMHRVGYLLNSIPQLEDVTEAECLHDQGKIPHRVWELISPLFGSGRKVVGDSGYMSNLELHCQAYRKNLGLLGTVNKNSKHLPAFNAREKREYIKNLGQGKSVRFYLISREEPITCTVYRDGSKRIFFFDNYLRLEPNFDVDLPYQKWRKKRKQKHYEDLTQPLVRKLYNEFKCAVDTNNQLLCYSNYHFKNKRKFFSLFWGKLIQFGICNPFILFKESQPTPKGISFRKELIDLAFVFQRQWLRKESL